ncbi:MAG: hypothetical protein O2807_00910 [bacterium]|nr:hypothetical protein [bacterium]
MKSFAPVNEKEFETAGLFLFGGLSLIMAILKLVNWNSPVHGEFPISHQIAAELGIRHAQP